MNKYMSNGWRTPGTKILTNNENNEISMIKFEIHAIGADLSVFVLKIIETGDGGVSGL